MDSGLVLVATAVALGLTALEALAGHLLGRPVYRFADTVSDLLQAVGHLVISTAFRLGQFVGYGLVLGIAPLAFDARSPLTWALAFVLYDALYYAKHVALHRVALLWAIHRVHHEPDQFNFAVAQRIPWLQDLTGWPFVLPMALVGIPLDVAAVVLLVQHLWQFLLHTELVPRLPWAEPFVLTPSSHRVHHACNPRYLDRNYGGFLSIWDHLFGTFEVEDERPIFGTVHPISTWDPLESNVGPLRELLRRAWRAPGWRAALGVWLGPPGGGVAGPPLPRTTPPTSASGRIVAAPGLAAGLAGMVAIVLWSPSAPPLALAAAGVAELALLVAVGRVLGAYSSPSTGRNPSATASSSAASTSGRSEGSPSAAWGSSPRTTAR